MSLGVTGCHCDYLGITTAVPQIPADLLHSQVGTPIACVASAIGMAKVRSIAATAASLGKRGAQPLTYDALIAYGCAIGQTCGLLFLPLVWNNKSPYLPERKFRAELFGQSLIHL
jgi:hypothetical protein